VDVHRPNATEHDSSLLRFHSMPTPYRQTPEWTHLPAPAAPVLTGDGLCSECRAPPMSICGDEVQICRSCLAVLWHLKPRAAATPKRVPPH
jgi:hypothetical protein